MGPCAPIVHLLSCPLHTHKRMLLHSLSHMPVSHWNQHTALVMGSVLVNRVFTAQLSAGGGKAFYHFPFSTFAHPVEKGAPG